MIAVIPYSTLSLSFNCITELSRKPNAIMPKIKAIKIEAICSHRPCPNGCSLSAFFDPNFAATITTIELIESESVCHASAANAIEPVIMLTHILRINNAVLIMVDTVPSIYPAFVLSILLSSINKILRRILPVCQPFFCQFFISV